MSRGQLRQMLHHLREKAEGESMTFVAVHESQIGPTRKWLSVPTTSAFWGTPDSLCSPRAFPSRTPEIA